MSYFELSLLAGLALGGIVGGQLWSVLGTGAFTALALLYIVAALLFFMGSVGSRRHRRDEVWQGLMRSLATPALQRLAPVWLCMNAIIGLWLGPTLYFLLTHRSNGQQLLAGLFADDPSELGWLLFVYALVFGAGVVAWSRALPRIHLPHALRVSLLAMLGVSSGLLLLNHMGDQPTQLRWTLTVVIAILIMVESGFTPAALSLLAGAVGPGVGRGAAMGIYSFLLSLGALAGSVLAAIAGRWLAIEGLTYATLGLAVVALAFLPRLGSVGRLTPEVPQTAGASNAEINRELSALKRMFTLAVQGGKLVSKPYIPMLKENNVRKGFFEPAQFESVKNHLPPHMQGIARFAHATGWRTPSEVLPLEWRQVDVHSGEVRLDPGTTKNDDARVFPFTTELRAVLEDSRAAADRLQREENIITPYVFFYAKGKKAGQRITESGFNKAWRKARVAAGCPGRIPHDFRRTAVRNLVRAGVPERVAMQLTGHKTRAVFERYNIVSPGDLRDAAQRLDSFMTSRSEATG